MALLGTGIVGERWEDELGLGAVILTRLIVADDQVLMPTVLFEMAAVFTPSCAKSRPTRNGNNPGRVEAGTVVAFGRPLAYGRGRLTSGTVRGQPEGSDSVCGASEELGGFPNPSDEHY